MLMLAGKKIKNCISEVYALREAFCYSPGCL